MEWCVLGPLEVIANGSVVPIGPPKQRALLISLLLHPNQVVSVDRLISDVWGDRPPRTAQHSVQLYVSELRRALADHGEAEIVTRSPGYELRVDAETIDAVRFERLVDAAMEQLTRDPSGAGTSLQTALALWRGPALADVLYEDFAQSEIRRLDDLRLDAEDALDETRLALGDVGSLVARLGRRAEDHPLRERTRGLYMQALAAAGRQADALRTFQDLRRRLGEELGIEPGPELRRIEERILLQDPAGTPIRPESAPRTVLRNPYKGLRPFLEDDAGDFFGRSDLTSQLDAAFDASRFVAVVGPSGSGKSSVIRAGLVPQIRRRRALRPVVMVPGEHPFGSLRAALIAEAFTAADGLPSAQPDVRWLVLAAERVLSDEMELVLIIDQFEELYTLSDGDEREVFLECLSEATRHVDSRIRVVAAMRADYYDRPLQDSDFGSLFTSRVVHVTQMTTAELEAAATQPASAAGLTIEPALLAEIVADVAGQPGGLPLFQFTLTELADDCEGAVLTAEAYRTMGGLRRGLIGRAEAAIDDLTKDERDAARQLAMRLIAITDQGVVGRRRVEAPELAALDVDPVVLRSVLERLGRHRLLTFDRNPVTGHQTVEFAHDALLDTWDRLQSWINESRNDLRRRASLSVAVAEWIEADRNPDFLPSGSQLQTYEEWRAASQLKLTEDERRFLDDARRRAAIAEEVETARVETERRLQRRARTRLLALIGVSVVLVTAAVTAFLATRPQGPEIALVFEGRGDESIGDLLAQGWDRADRDLTFRGEEIVGPVSPADELRSLAASGTDLIIAASLFLTEPVTQVAPEYPETAFVSIDQAIDRANVTSYLFAHSEGSFLAGAAAALTSRTGTVGFVGGLPIPIIEEFRAGFEAGARHVDPDVAVLAIYLTEEFDTGTAFMRPDLGFEAGATLYDLGADVVFHAAAVSGWGVVDAAVAGSTGPEGKLWVIGVDSDQYVQADPVQRPFILTSMIKQFDVATELAVRDFIDGKLAGGTRVLGLQEKGVRLATSGDHLLAISDDLAAIEAALVSGQVQAPLVPVGPVLPPLGVAATTSSRILYEAETCIYDGPLLLNAGEALEVDLVNRSEETAFIGMIPLAEEMTLEEVMVPSDDGQPPSFLLIHESVGRRVEPGAESSVTTPSLVARSYLVVCTGAIPHGAAIVEAR